ncbi:MAG: ATP-binding protein, partial [Gemmatimonadetes bacterium]|nr:ATP-binding protein [Gemmatimonadota bacterium]
GTVIASACPSLKDPDSFEVAVRDTGRGIPEEEQAQIFDRLYQVSEDCWADKGGLGLGLYLCKEVVDLHGGTIWVESTSGEGSEFRFRIPVGPTAASDHQQTPAALQVEG